MTSPAHFKTSKPTDKDLKDDPGIETHSVEVEGTDKKAILLRPKHT